MGNTNFQMGDYILLDDKIRCRYISSNGDLHTIEVNGKRMDVKESRIIKTNH